MNYGKLGIGHWLNQGLARLLLGVIQFYRYAISPLLPARCRFYPTCSSYGIEAVRLHGGWLGGWLTIKRVCRCHPWGGSGVDFVPLPLYRYQYHYVMRRDNANGWGMLPHGFGVWYWRVR
ncbi:MULTISPECIES: membrane protein insertion efficiency factor YidD [unclassified Moraxella]|uniref:membrane protein insertion efficiency factor YidD n=1 Tax=unclassified Moraxella TaxID=2685852 RepID=UPI003AF5AF39